MGWSLCKSAVLTGHIKNYGNFQLSICSTYDWHFNFWTFILNHISWILIAKVFRLCELDKHDKNKRDKYKRVKNKRDKDKEEDFLTLLPPLLRLMTEDAEETILQLFMDSSVTSEEYLMCLLRKILFKGIRNYSNQIKCWNSSDWVAVWHTSVLNLHASSRKQIHFVLNL